MTTLQDHENRIDTRVDLEATIFLELLASDKHSPGTIVMCNSLDLSANGLQIVVDDEITAGSIFRLCIDLKDAEPIFLVAEVEWQRPDPDSEAYRIGFLLFESDDTDIDRWHQLMNSMLGD
jgi:hypothetical protein